MKNSFSLNYRVNGDCYSAVVKKGRSSRRKKEKKKGKEDEEDEVDPRLGRGEIKDENYCFFFFFFLVRKNYSRVCIIVSRINKYRKRA